MIGLENMKTLHALNGLVREYAAEIDKRNRSSFVLFSNGALILSALIFSVTLLVPDYRSLMPSHGIIFLYSALLFFFSRWCSQKNDAYIRLEMYLAFVPLLVGAVLLGTVLDPLKPAISIVIYICLLPLFIIDRPDRIIAYQIFFAVVFVIMSRLCKPAQIFRDDTLYLPIYLALGIGTNIFSLMERVESAKNYCLLRHESERDSLTTLLNRKSGEEKLKVLFQSQVHGTFAIVDIDDFKGFNDRYGHQTGDCILQEVSRAILSVFRTSDIVWRLGGDEFAVYAVNMTDAATCIRRFEAVRDRLSAISLPAGVNEKISVSVGCTVCLGEHLNFEEVYKTSDASLYRAKKSGKGRMVISGQEE